nr:gliding motility-associated C-terminal domain-containing protein [uncultured Lacibacter sp.]
MLTRLGANGNIIWSKAYVVQGSNIGLEKMYGCIDYNDNVITSIASNCLMLTNLNGDPLIVKRLTIPSQYVVITDVAIAPNNDKIVLVRDYSSYGDEGYMLVRLSSDLSTIIWNKYFAEDDLYLTDLSILGDKAIVSGSADTRGLFMVFDLTTGGLLHQQKIYLDNGGSYYRISEVKQYDKGYVFFVSNSNGLSESKAVFRLDNSFNIRNTYYLSPIRSDIELKFDVDNNGTITAMGTANSPFNFFRISAGDSVLFHRTSMITSFSYPSDLKKTNDGYVGITSGNYTAVGVGNFGFSSIVNFDANGNIPGCASREEVLEKRSLNWSATASSINSISTNKLSLQTASAATTSNSFNEGRGCQYINICNTLEVTGNTNICGVNSAVYKAKRNAGCGSPISWKLNGANALLEQFSDSTLRINFEESGNYELIGAIYNICDTLYDTLQIKVTLVNSVLDLGTDTTLCTGNTILLNAKKGFNSYRWQDGTSDSTFVVTQPGRYYVSTEDACGNTFSDTINVSPAPQVPLSIGPDRTKCNADTLQLTAPTGFLNYSWGPGYNISSQTTRQIVVNPLIDTVYYLKAEKTPGCFGFDTIRVKVNTSPAITLGNDTSFCSGQSITLSAGAGFVSHQWNNGNTDAQTSVSNKGIYSVAGTTAEGCKSYDTLQVLNVYANPVVQLNKDTGLCVGSFRLLDAGNFSSYIWNNGSVAQSISVTGIGNYKVTVTDVNGCKGADSSSITVLYPVPARFLLSDTSICSYGSMVLNANGSFQSYLWNTNSTSPSIEIKKPGQYWLQVTDVNQCSGKDTISVIQKECMVGLYVPNAFTPDGNGLNDEFKPMLFGDVEQFQFTVFNRWGQMIFQSADRLRGWDGAWKGIPQVPGLYTWTCSYKLAGETAVIKKGTVTLIR